MRTTNFDAIAAAAPLNREASVVRDGSGDTWEANIPSHTNRWLAPPELKPLSSLVEKRSSALAAENIGKRFGRLTVVGIWAGSNPKKKATWVCRCDCGYYEGRKLKGLLHGGPDQMACHACVPVMRMQRGGKSSTTGTRAADAGRLDRLAADTKNGGGA